MNRYFAVTAFALLLSATIHAQPEEPFAVPPDSPRWDLQGQAKLSEYKGEKALLLDGGAAILKDFEMRDAVIDVDVATPGLARFFWLRHPPARRRSEL